MELTRGRLIDCHSHILPQFDDGAKHPDESLALLSILLEQGVTDVILSPHYYPSRETVDHFLKRRAEAIEVLRSLDGIHIHQEAGSPAFASFENERGKLDLYLGAEVALSPQLFTESDLKRLCIAESHYLLVELAFTTSWDANVIAMLDRLIYQEGIQPIIAHIERYPASDYGKNLDVLRILSELPCLFQMNVDSLGERRLRKQCRQLLEGQWIDFLGSDCHNLEKRPPRFDLMQKYTRRWKLAKPKANTAILRSQNSQPKDRS